MNVTDSEQRGEQRETTGRRTRISIIKTRRRKMDALDHSIREANIPYAERPQYKEKLPRKFDLDQTREERMLTAPIWEERDGLWHNVVPRKFQGRQRLHKLDGLLETGGKEATQGLELLTFSGNRDTREDRSGTKHIGATDLLKEMTRRRTANPD
jgi:hypothetical protein